MFHLLNILTIIIHFHVLSYMEECSWKTVWALRETSSSGRKENFCINVIHTTWRKKFRCSNWRLLAFTFFSIEGKGNSTQVPCYSVAIETWKIFQQKVEIFEYFLQAFFDFPRHIYYLCVCMCVCVPLYLSRKRVQVQVIQLTRKIDRKSMAARIKFFNVSSEIWKIDWPRAMNKNGMEVSMFVNFPEPMCPN